ncbi:hypothetical protein E0M25_04720 [Bacillus mycoides]|nr:hypothetical protein EXW58_14020 [Bacillus mycoides]QWG36424.1 hypothetical protein EXW30_14460 [Bacillus mycoides]TBX81596.1 hypothetical protein E0M25_04720 [Bacillus mycoides]
MRCIIIPLFLYFCFHILL